MAGGVAEFAVFLKDELIPVIESRYPADPSRRCFAEYSLGGLLGVYLLTADPEMFQYYLLGSPSLWFNNFYLDSVFTWAPVERLKGIGSVHLSVGEEESWEMLKGFDVLRTGFRHKGFEGSRIKTEIISQSAHVGAMPTALYKGLRFLFRNH